MIAGDLDTDTASNVTEQPRSSFFQAVFRSFARENNSHGTPNRSRSNTGQKVHVDHRAQSAAYDECVSSLSFFIHDGTLTTDEGDDPYNAICFFHPPNYTPTEQWEFTGPIVGAVRFMTSFANSPPKIIHLTNSSIALLCFDNYTVALKASKVLSSSALEACLRDLYNVFSLFFNDIKFVKKLCRDDEPEVALGRFKYNLAHIWTKLIGLVGPFKLLQPIAHIPHFASSEDAEIQLYQFFACILAILSGFSRNTFGCLLSYNSQLVQSTFDISLTRTLMLASSLIRNMPQTAHVLPSSSRLPKGAFVRYAFATRSQLLESRVKFRSQLKALPLAARALLSRFDSSLLESAFTPQEEAVQSERSSDTPNSVILARYFDFAWTMAGQNNEGQTQTGGIASFEASFSTTISQGQENQLPGQEGGDHWESNSSSMSSVAINLNGVFPTSHLYSPISNTDKGNDLSRSVSIDGFTRTFPNANFDRIWDDNGSAPRNSTQSAPRIPSDFNQDPFGHFSRLSHVLHRSNDDDEDDEEFKAKTFFSKASKEDKAFASFPNLSTSNLSVPGTLADAVRNAASLLVLNEDSRESGTKQPPGIRLSTNSSTPFSANGILDSGHSPVHFTFDDHHDQESSETDDHNSTEHSEPEPEIHEPEPSNGRKTDDSGNPDSVKNRSDSVFALIGDGDANEIMETVLYMQSHGPLSLIALVPNSPSLIKAEDLRTKLYEVLLQILADICSLLMHFESESAAEQPNEAVVVSFEPSRQRLHRLGLCRACNSDIRFDTQLFTVQRLFAKDQNIRDLQISDWSSHVRVTKEADPPPEGPSVLSDSMAPYRQGNAASQQRQGGRHSYGGANQKRLSSIVISSKVLIFILIKEA